MCFSEMGEEKECLGQVSPSREVTEVGGGQYEEDDVWFGLLLCVCVSVCKV